MALMRTRLEKQGSDDEENGDDDDDGGDAEHRDDDENYMFLSDLSPIIGYPCL